LSSLAQFSLLSENFGNFSGFATREAALIKEGSFEVRVVKTYSLHGLKILSKMSGRRLFAQYGPIERRPIVTSRFTEARKRSEQEETKEI
jgi:hypothetical protein